MRYALVVTLLFGLGSCISVNFSADSDQTPIPLTRYETLQPGLSDLTDVLETLGAPHIVLDTLNGRVVVAYVWSETDDLGLQLSFAALNRFARAARFRFDSTAGNFEGVVVFCDRNLVVQSIRRGPLQDLLGGETDDSVTSIVQAFLL